MPAAYVIVEMKVSDPEQYKQYMASAPGDHCGMPAASTSCAAGGTRRWKATGNRRAWRSLKFPSYEKAKAWYDAGRLPQPCARSAPARPSTST